MKTIDDVPGPRAFPVVGNLFDIDSHDPIGGMMRTAEEYGPVFRLSLPGGTRLVVSSPELVAQVCDDALWDKHVGGGLSAIGGAETGLFTAETTDPLWARAHHILMSPFSLPSMRDYQPKMVDLANQLADKWSRLNPGDEVDVPADMTRLTLDTIALCGFGYRFNSFYRDTPHPFVEAMVRVLTEAQTRARQPKIATRLRIRAQRQAEEDLAFMNGLVDGLIAERRAQGAAADTSDLLGRMITGTDREGRGLPDENIRAQCITFLIAGHETTSGLLSFALYYLLKDPAAMERARAEVDAVLGEDAEPTFDQVLRLTYVRQVLDEALRLWPTAPAFTRHALQDTTLGEYTVPRGTQASVLIPALHRDTGAWGPDAASFDPDHMSPERVAALPPHAYHPFGTGARACIGRQFALQEAVIVLATVLQRFELVDTRDYRLHTTMTLTIKPADFLVGVRSRERTLRRVTASTGTGQPARAAQATIPRVARHGTPLAVLFGSNLGTAEALATTLAAEATDRGFAVTLGPLDDHVGDLPSATVVVCSSYNGTPPDNAAEFCRWIAGDATVDTAFTVFGCGSTEWAATYQAVPHLLDERLEACGGTRIHPRGEQDARGDADAAYRDWHATLWSDLATALDLPAEVGAALASGPRLAVTLANRQTTNPVILSYRARPARIRGNRELIPSGNGKPADRSTRHVEVTLPEGVTYRAGDHLGVLPRNGIDLIRRVIARFGLDAGQYLTIIPNGSGFTHLPIDEPAPLLGVLGSCVELQDTATRADVEAMARHLPEVATLDYPADVAAPRRSLLDLLERFPECALPFAEFLDRLPPLRPRYYSISSSPLVDAQVATITAGVVRGPARSGSGVYTGVCSGHLAGLPEDGTAFVFVKEPSIPFRPPAADVPMIMIGAGTGFAPFRGFLQERAAAAATGPVARSLLFLGCRGPEIDLLYGDELAAWSEIVDVEYAFSRAGEEKRYVQDAIRERAEDVWALLQQNGAVFVCGNASTMAPAVRASLQQVFRAQTGAGAADAEAWLAGLRAQNRFLEDIWGS